MNARRRAGGRTRGGGRCSWPRTWLYIAVVDRAGPDRHPVLVQLRALAQRVAGLLVPLVVGRRRTRRWSTTRRCVRRCEQPGAGRADDAHRHAARRRPGARPGPLARAGRPRGRTCSCSCPLSTPEIVMGTMLFLAFDNLLHVRSAGPHGDAARARHVLDLLRGRDRAWPAVDDRPGRRGGGAGSRCDADRRRCARCCSRCSARRVRQPDDRVRHVDRRLRDLGVPVGRRVHRDGADQDLLDGPRLADAGAQRDGDGDADRDGRRPRARRPGPRVSSAAASGFAPVEGLRPSSMSDLEQVRRGWQRRHARSVCGWRKAKRPASGRRQRVGATKASPSARASAAQRSQSARAQPSRSNSTTDSSGSITRRSGAPSERTRSAAWRAQRDAGAHRGGEGVRAVDDEGEPERQAPGPAGEVERQVGRVDVLVAEGVEVRGGLAVRAAAAAGSRYRTAAQSSGANSHLCGSMTSESARSMPANRGGELGHAEGAAAVGGVDVQPPPRSAHTSRRRRGRRWRPVFVAPALAATAQIARRRRGAGERVGGEPVAVVTGDLDDVEIEQRGSVAHRRVGRRRAGHRQPPRRGCARRHTSRATARPLRLPAEPPDTKQPAAPSRQPGERAQPVEGGVLGGDGGTGLLPALAGERPGADDGVEQRGRRRRRRRDVGEEAVVVEGDVVRQQHLVDQSQGGVDAECRPP